jgi:hypothetical protein
VFQSSEQRERFTQALAMFRHQERMLESAKIGRDLALRDLQDACPHAHVVECASGPTYVGDTHNVSQPPERVCQDCGLWEQGWGTGYDQLRGSNGVEGSAKEIRQVPRERVMALIRRVEE